MTLRESMTKTQDQERLRGQILRELDGTLAQAFKALHACAPAPLTDPDGWAEGRERDQKTAYKHLANLRAKVQHLAFCAEAAARNLGSELEHSDAELAERADWQAAVRKGRAARAA